ncbi:MAG: hypothetical protein ACLVD2_04390 [Blautia sp.]
MTIAKARCEGCVCAVIEALFERQRVALVTAKNGAAETGLAACHENCLNTRSVREL